MTPSFGGSDTLALVRRKARRKVLNFTCLSHFENEAKWSVEKIAQLKALLKGNLKKPKQGQVQKILKMYSVHFIVPED